MGITVYRVAKDIGVPPIRINEIVRAKRAVSAETALLLARYFGTSAELWLRLQDQYDLEIAETEIKDKLEKISPRRELQAA
jgi:addiction module HigA family antidote